MTDATKRWPGTLAALNRYLRVNGMPEGTMLVRGRDYFYFAGIEPAHWPESGVYVYRLRDLSYGQWLEEYRRLSENVRL